MEATIRLQTMELMAPPYAAPSGRDWKNGTWSVTARRTGTTARSALETSRRSRPNWDYGAALAGAFTLSALPCARMSQLVPARLHCVSYLARLPHPVAPY